MPFIESAQSQRSVAHVSDVKAPILVGILVVVGLALVLFGSNVVAAASGTQFELSQASDESMPTQDEQETVEEADVSPATLYVFVSGAVANPGVYMLEDGARLGDVVEMAGGFSDGAAQEYNNLARPLNDGEQVHVPLQSELNNTEVPVEQIILRSADGGSGQPGLVNINTASQAELETLPGVGPSTAKKIIASRESEGSFASVDELMRVSGIGEKKYSALEGLICV